ncbi:hypothetical protein [uncultured Chitinophaga sp.]|uniref:hypothetical protein n=1 Tax=uncultured Chitinophaga sp. TaxID=339340 RepID=UPI0025DBAC37|nr:hypothetical protein [uncultured Chitinophaga sp.]
MEIHIKIIGILLVILSLIHAIFPKYFRWSEEMATISLINRQMMYVHTFFLAIVLLLMGLLCLTSAADLSNTSFSRKVALGIGIFWLLRLFIQFFGYSSSLWKGKRFETSVHVVFSLLWTYLSGVFLGVYFM